MMNEKLRAAAQAALAVVRMVQRSHREILLTYKPIDPLVHNRVYLRLEDAIKAVENALAEPAIKESLTVQRPWVCLTDKEIDEIYKEHHNQYGKCKSVNFGYERAIEAKLREKNI